MLAPPCPRNCPRLGHAVSRKHVQRLSRSCCWFSRAWARNNLTGFVVITRARIGLLGTRSASASNPLPGNTKLHEICIGLRYHLQLPTFSYSCFEFSFSFFFVFATLYTLVSRAPSAVPVVPLNFFMSVVRFQGHFFS